MLYTRRELATLALTGLPAAWLLKSAEVFAQTKPNSKWAGVQVGMNVPWNFGNTGMSGEDILKNCVQLAVSAVELRAQPVEAFLGMPANLASGGRGGRGGGRGAVTPEQQAVQKANAEELRKWRAAVSMDKVAAFRKMFETEGVLIQIVRWDGIFDMSDDELDYVFQLS